MLRFLAGVASAGVFVFASTAVLGVLAQRGRLDLTGWLYTGVGLGIGLSGLLVLIIDRLTRDGTRLVRAEWLGVTALALALMGPCWAWLPRRGADVGVPGPTSAGRRSRRVGAPILLLGLAYFLEGAGYIVTGTFIVAIVAALPGLADLGAGAWILVGIAAAPSTLLWARLAGRLGLVLALAVAFFVQAGGVVLPALSDQAWAAATSAVLFGGTFLGITTLTISYARTSAAPAQAAGAIAALTAAFGLGQVIGPPIAAHLAEGDDFGRALVVAAVAVAVGGILVLAVERLARQERPPNPS